MKSIVVFFLLVSFVGAFYSCQEHSTESQAACAPGDSLNPNGQSELAGLMREMVAHAEACRNFLDGNGTFPAYPVSVKRLKTAAPTKPDMKEGPYDQLADVYLSSLEQLYGASKEGQKEKYQFVVNACQGCHLSFCPGPLKKIETLHLKGL